MFSTCTCTRRLRSIGVSGTRNHFISILPIQDGLWKKQPKRGLRNYFGVYYVALGKSFHKRPTLRQLIRPAFYIPFESCRALTIHYGPLSMAKHFEIFLNFIEKSLFYWLFIFSGQLSITTNLVGPSCFDHWTQTRSETP